MISKSKKMILHISCINATIQLCGNKYILCMVILWTVTKILPLAVIIGLQMQEC